MLVFCLYQSCRRVERHQKVLRTPKEYPGSDRHQAEPFSYFRCVGRALRRTVKTGIMDQSVPLGMTTGDHPDGCTSIDFIVLHVAYVEVFG